MVDTLLVYQNGDTKHIGLAQPLPPVLRLPDYWPGPLPAPWEGVKVLRFQLETRTVGQLSLPASYGRAAGLIVDCPVYRQLEGHEYL